jgi:radical SAM superfamily enzyme YgiQ (UPF0313 family)
MGIDYLRTVRRTILRIEGITPPAIRKLIIRIVPARILSRILSKYATIYPIEIPKIKFLPDQELILLELPQRYTPMMPNGLGYVHNILKTTGIRFQTVDLNIIFYHRYHSRKILDGLDKVISSSGYVMPDDPWETTSSNEWSKPEVIDYFRPEINEVINGLVKARPKIIGISLSGTNRTVAREVVKGVRALYPEVIILVGGYDCVYHYVAPHLFPEYDYIVIGEAELTLGPLLKALVAGEKPKDLPGVISKHDSPGRTWVAAPLLKDLDAIDFPRYDWIDLNLYRNRYDWKVVPIISSRGCRWSRCRFCCECFAWRRRSPKKVVDEMEWFTKQGFDKFLFNESDMNGDPEALLAICDEILRCQLKIAFSGELRVDKRGTPEFFKRLHEAGCSQLVFGVDGWADHTLRLQNKGYTMSMVEENLRNCHEAGISVNVNMVIGVPGETEEDITESINNIIKCKGYISCFQNLNILILGAGSEYYLNPEQFDICFRGEKRELYEKYPYFIPPEFWYNVNPYIDNKVRVERLRRIFYALSSGGVNVGKYAQWEVERDSLTVSQQ